MIFAAAEIPTEEKPDDEPNINADDKIVVFPGVNIRQVARMLKFFKEKRKKNADNTED